MRVSDRLEPGAKFALVLTADGRWERRILVGLAPKLNGKLLLWFPPPLGRTGLRGLAEAIRIHLEEAYKARPGLRAHPISMLILVDKEHFRRPADAQEELVRALKERGIEVVGITPLEAGDAFSLRGKYGYRPFTAFVAVLGVERCLDEQIALLLEQYKGIKVEADYGPIMRALRRLGLDLEELVAERTLTELGEKLPSLVAALEALEPSSAEGQEKQGREGREGCCEGEGPGHAQEVPQEAHYGPRGQAGQAYACVEDA